MFKTKNNLTYPILILGVLLMLIAIIFNIDNINKRVYASMLAMFYHLSLTASYVKNKNWDEVKNNKLSLLSILSFVLLIICFSASFISEANVIYIILILACIIPFFIIVVDKTKR